MNQEKAHSLFSYLDGSLFWKMNRGSNAKKGARAGKVMKTGYRAVQVSGKSYREHRLVFLMHMGYLPEQIDHINGIKTDNRIENLRPTTCSQNQMNTADRSESRGVRWVEKSNKWAARVCLNGKEIRVGSFKTQQEAVEARLAKAKELFGEFVR